MGLLVLDFSRLKGSATSLRTRLGLNDVGDVQDTYDRLEAGIIERIEQKCKITLPPAATDQDLASVPCCSDEDDTDIVAMISTLLQGNFDNIPQCPRTVDCPEHSCIVEQMKQHLEAHRLARTKAIGVAKLVQTKSREQCKKSTDDGKMRFLQNRVYDDDENDKEGTKDRSHFDSAFDRPSSSLFGHPHQPSSFGQASSPPFGQHGHGHFGQHSGGAPFGHHGHGFTSQNPGQGPNSGGYNHQGQGGLDFNSWNVPQYVRPAVEGLLNWFGRQTDSATVHQQGLPAPNPGRPALLAPWQR